MIHGLRDFHATRIDKMTMIVAIGILLLVSAGRVANGQAAGDLTLRLVEYHVRDASTETATAALDRTKDAAAVLALFRGVEPRLLVTRALRPGEPASVEEPRARGTVTVNKSKDGRFEVTLALERFFNGTPLLIDGCRPFVVARLTARVQGRTQLTVRAVEIDHAGCPAPSAK